MILTHLALFFFLGAGGVVEAPVQVTPTSLTAGSDATVTDVYTTASVIAHAGKLITIAIEASRLASATGTATVTGFGKTFVSAGFITFNTNATPRSRISLFRTMLTSDQTGAVTISYAAANDGIAWSLLEWDGVPTTGTDGADAIRQVAVNRGQGDGAPLATLTGIVSGNATYAAFGFDIGVVFTPGFGYTVINHETVSSPVRDLVDEWRLAGSTPVDGTTDGSDWGGVAIEIVSVSGDTSGAFKAAYARNANALLGTGRIG